jgi:pimeloyl-ACP methyl ester carboxylesterase
MVADILATDGAARAGVGASLAEGRFTDEVQIVASLDRPLAVLHGAREQLVNLDYLRTLTLPTLWRGEVQLVEHAGHAVQEETPRQLADLLTAFVSDV